MENQEIKKGDYVFTESEFTTKYLTKDKKYLVDNVFEYEGSIIFCIYDDEDFLLYCRLNKCCHIDGNNWQIHKP